MNTLQKTLFYILLFFANSVFGQAFSVAPKINKKVKEITEWHRSDLKAKAIHSSTTGYDRKGNLIYHYPKDAPKDKWNHYKYDRQNRLIKKEEYFEDIVHKTSITYQPNVSVAIYSFHDKTYRICDYFKNGRVVETKTFAKGGEIEKPGYVLIKRNLYYYNNRDSLKSEKIESYGIIGRGRGKVVHSEKIKHQYDPTSHLRIHSEYFNSDNSLRMERFYSYNKTGKLDKIMDFFHKERRVQSISFLYKNKKIWQKITEKENQKSVLVFVDGRPLRRRNYLSGQLIKVVDYGYKYY